MPYKIKSFNKRSTRHTLLISALVLLALSGLTAGGYIVRKNKIAATASGLHSPSNPPGTQKLNLEPPTVAEQQESNARKETIVKQMAQDDGSSTNGQKSITPQIVDATQYGQVIEVRVLIPQVYEAGGTCTMTFRFGTSLLNKTVAAVQDSTTTRCTPLAIPRNEFTAAGTWSVIVSYGSDSAKGTSAPRALEIK